MVSWKFLLTGSPNLVTVLNGPAEEARTMRDAVVVEAVRTPIGKGKPHGALARVHPSNCSPTPCAPSSNAPAWTRS